MNQNRLARIAVAMIAWVIIAIIISAYRFLKYKNSEEGKLHKKLEKKKDILLKVSKLENSEDIINKDLVETTKKNLKKEIENDILRYELERNKEYIELQNLKKQGIIDNQSFNNAARKIEQRIKGKSKSGIRLINLDSGEVLKVELFSKNTLKNAKLISHLDQFENEIIKSNDQLFEISSNKIKNVFRIKHYENGFVIAQQNSRISSGDRILEPIKDFNYDLIKLLPICAIRINKDIVTQVYWVKKGKTLFNQNIDIYQKSHDNWTFGDLVYINSIEAKNGIHFISIHGSFSMIKTKNGKII